MPFHRTARTLVAAAGLSLAAGAAQAIRLDLRTIIEGVPSDLAICEDRDPAHRVCISQFLNAANEWTLAYAFGTPTDPPNPKIIDYMARSTRPGHDFGVIRNLDRSGEAALFRCFAATDPPQVCRAPHDARHMPENLPVILDLPEVDAATVRATEQAATGAPVRTIPGAAFIHGHAFASLAVNQMDPHTCAQAVGAEIAIRVSAAWVRRYPFGGDIGERDALVVDEEERGSANGAHAPEPTHLERYFYVPGFGRVKEGSGNYNPATGVYDVHNTGSSVRNKVVRPNPVPQPAILCPQGSAPMP